MEKITVNTDAREMQINAEVKSCIEQIQNNAKQGISTTELYVPKHIGGEVRSRISKLLEESGTRYDWRTVKRSPNEYTGAMQSFSSDTIGDEKYYKLAILN